MPLVVWLTLVVLEVFVGCYMDRVDGLIWKWLLLLAVCNRINQFSLNGPPHWIAGISGNGGGVSVLIVVRCGIAPLVVKVTACSGF